MATVNVASSQNLTAVTYAALDTVNVQDGVLLSINSAWTTRPLSIQALGTGRIEVSNTSTTTPMVLEFAVNANSAGFSVQQNGALQIRGNWITVATSTGTANQTLFSSNNIGGVAIDYPSLIEVETGSGTNVWEVWQAIPEDVSGGTANIYGWNKADTNIGTVAVSAAGAVTGIGTNFQTTHIGIRFKLPLIARDFVISAVASTTACTIQEMSGATYTGGTISAGSAYLVRDGSLINKVQVGNQDLGKVLFFNPLTTAVRMGDGTNGTIIPSGAMVRVPNIHLNSQLQSTTLTAAITSTAAQAITVAAAVGPTSNTAFSTTAQLGTLLLVSGGNVERIHYTTRSGNTYSATSQTRGMYGTVAQSYFPIGTAVYWLPSPSGTTFNSTVVASPSGTVDVQVCSAGVRFALAISNYASLILKHFGGNNFITSGGAGGFQIDTVSCIGANFQMPGLVVSGLGVNLASMLGQGSISNIHAFNNLTGIATTVSNITLTNVPALTNFSKIKSRIFNRQVSLSGSSVRAINLSNVSCSTPIDGLYVAGGSVILSVNNSADIKNIFISGQPNADSSGSTDALSCLVVSNASNNILRSISVWGGGSCTRNPIINVDAGCQNNVIHNKGSAAIDGNQQCASISSDAGLNTTISHFTLTNPRITNTSGDLNASVTTNTGGAHRLLLIDSVTSTATATGIPYKGLMEIDVVSGPHRLWSSTTTVSIVPNLVDVQPIVVLSNVAKTVASLFIGSFSAQNAFAMYDLSSIGQGYLDNLGRIYLPGLGDSIIIKSVFSNKGILSFSGSTFDYNYNLGSGTNAVPADITIEFRLSNWGSPNTGSWTPLVSNTDLQTSLSGLSGYSSSVGFDLQIRVTTTTASSGRYLMNMKFPVNLDTSYNPAVSNTQIGIAGAPTGTLLAVYDNSNPTTPILRDSLVISGTIGAVKMPYDYDAVPVAYRIVARKAGRGWVSLSGVYTNLAISIPVSMPILSWYTTGASGVAFNHIAHTITIISAVSPIQVASAYQDDLSQLANMALPEFLTCDGVTFSTTYTVVLSGAGAITGSYTDAAGLHVSVTSSALDAGTLVQIWDVASATELYVGVPSGALSLPIVYPGADKTLRLRAMQCGATSASRFVEQLGTLTSAGASFLVTQAPDQVYASNAIDGSTVTGVTIDDTLMRFVLAGRTSISWAEIYAYETWWLSTVAGMRDDGRIITAIDPANYVLAGCRLRNDNPGGVPITITGGWGRDSVTGQTITLIDTTGGPIFAAPDAVIAYGQSAATPAEIWSHASRTLTADPGAAGHAATQAAIAAVQSVAQAARDQAALAVALSA